MAACKPNPTECMIYSRIYLLCPQSCRKQVQQKEQSLRNLDSAPPLTHYIILTKITTSVSLSFLIFFQKKDLHGWFLRCFKYIYICGDCWGMGSIKGLNGNLKNTIKVKILNQKNFKYIF